jgi:hypothetical protein
MPSRRLQGKKTEITLDQAQQREKRAQRQAKRARVVAAAAAKVSEAASDTAAAMLGLGEKSVEKNDQKEETSSPKVFSQVSSASLMNTNSPALPLTGALAAAGSLPAGGLEYLVSISGFARQDDGKQMQESQLSDSDSSSESDSSDDSSDEDRPMPKKRVKLVAKKAGGPGASGRKRSVAALASPVLRIGPKKRAKSSAKAAYSKKELRTSQQLSLKNFIKTNMIFNKTAKMNKLQRDSFVVNSAGTPIGTKMNAMNQLYKAWALKAKGKYVGTGMDGHLRDRCNKQCCAGGHRLNVCPALKTHLAHKLGRKMRGNNKLWKNHDGVYFYKGAFLKK